MSSPSIAVSRLCWSTPDGRSVLSDIDLRLARERTAIVGRNGAGKTTLLRLIAHELAPRSGTVAVTGTVAMLRQVARPSPQDRIADLFGVAGALALLRKAEAGLADADELADADWTLEPRIADALAAVGLAGVDATTPLVTLSGGQGARAALAGAIFARPDFLLLDEPTNNLDRDGRRAVRAFLDGWRGGAVIVSHDRELLEGVDAIVELGPHGAVRHGGGWSRYSAARDAREAAAEAALDDAQRHVAQVRRQAQQAAERQSRRDSGGRRKAARGDMPRILIGARKQRAEESAGAGSRLAERQQAEAQAALDAARARVEVVDPLSVALASANLAASRTVLEMRDVTAGYDPDRPVLRNLSLTVTGPERLAISGPNGAGKSTLLALVAGRLRPWRGRARTGVRFALFDQRVAFLDPALSIAGNYLALNPGATNNGCRAALAHFGFRAAAADRIAGTLSGGQLLRAGLACTLGAPQPPQLLILDEPTNHLDLDSLAAVERGLSAYDGALLVVSHDAAFLRAIGIERCVELAASPPQSEP